MSSKIPSLTPKGLSHTKVKDGYFGQIGWQSPDIHATRWFKRVIVPLHKKDLPKGTLHSILKQARIDKNEL